jgi:hypothetical protein
MKQLRVGIIASITISAWAGATPVLAQYFTPMNALNQPNLGPTVSPWLGLRQGGGSAAANYINLVSPQLYTNQRTGVLQQQITTNQQAITGLQQQPDQVIGTGHPVGFLNYQKYFLNTRATAAGVGQGVTGTGPGYTTGGFVGGRTGFGTGQGVGWGGAGFGGPRSGVGGPGAFRPSGSGGYSLPY